MALPINNVNKLHAVLPPNAKPWYRQGHLVKLNFCLISCMMYASTNGYDGTLLNGFQSLNRWVDFMEDPDATWLGTINCLYWITVGVVAPVSSWAAGKWGRKIPSYCGFIFLIASTCLQAVAQNPAMFIVARTILGGSTACFGIAVPLLIAELAYPTQRAIMSNLYPAGFFVGSSISAWSVYGMRNYASSWCWRLPTILQVLCPLSGLVGLYLSPESPRWLISEGRIEDARQILVDWHAGGDTNSALVEFEMAEIIEAVRAEKEASGTARFSDLWKGPGNRHRLFITITIGFFAQWVGNNVVSYYLALVLDTVGVTSADDQTLVSACLQFWNLIFAVIGALFIDRLGRRMIFQLSFAIMLVSYVIVTGLSGSFASTGNASTGLAVIPFLFVFYAGYGISLTPLLIAYPLEIWTFQLRALGLSVVWMSTVVSVVFNVFVNPIALSAIGWKYYLVFVAVLVSYGVTAYYFYPETRGYTLEEMAIVFDGDKSALAAVQHIEGLTVHHEQDEKPTKQ
ncbi:general substrate transporter [Ilyonectria robusta]